MKRAEIYPDSDDTYSVGEDGAPVFSDGADETYDRIEFKYNRLGEVTEIKDQNETVHAFDYDALGRQTQDRVTPLSTGVDGAVRRIASTFEVRGMREKITSYDNATVGSGSVVNEVQFAYNDFGQITHDCQAHGGAVNTSTTPKVQYGYASGSADTIRPTAITYPDGREITYDYGTAGGMNDALSRIAAIVDDDAGSTHLADYSYLGLGPARALLPTVNSPFTPGALEVDYTEPDIRYTLVGTAGGTDPDTGDIYRGYDRFGRVKDCYWYNYATSTDVDRIKYGYDRNGSRIWRENTVAASYGKDFDELYGYDLIDRLKAMDRGDLDANKNAVSNLQFAQDWSLDATGNWRNFREDNDGDATWDLDQPRTANQVNEITAITETAGPSWVTPVYNRAGNMTTIPKPADPTQSFTATYDAWNRLVKIEQSGHTVAEYEYDGAKRRSVKKTYTGGQLDETRHFYYTEPSRWQAIEERIGSSITPDRQFVWGLRYIDDILVRDRDTTSDGTLDERLYGMQDANWNVTSVASAGGVLQERYGYHPYGTPIVLTGEFAFRASSIFHWETMFAGYRWDGALMLFHVRNRIYAAAIGKWSQRDPLRLLRMSNLYRYVLNTPISRTDPFGLLPCPPGNAFCEFITQDWVSCACFVIQLLDTLGGVIAAFVDPFLVAYPPAYVASQVIQLLLSSLDCACDMLSIGADYCMGNAVSWLQLAAAGGSCLFDIVGIFLNVQGIRGITTGGQVTTQVLSDFDTVAIMGEFLTFAVGHALAGGGFGVQPGGHPAGYEACRRTFPGLPALGDILG